jgi:hypothetical protein
MARGRNPDRVAEAEDVEPEEHGVDVVAAIRECAGQ